MRHIHQTLVSRRISLFPSKPMQAFKKLSRALRCLLRLLTTSVPNKTGKQSVKRIVTMKQVRTGLNKRCFKHVAEERQDRIERRETFLLLNLAVLDTSQ